MSIKKEQQGSEAKMKIGVIADDFTGATDATSFIVKGGLSAIQFSGVPDEAIDIDADALVISLKSRSCFVEQAIEQSIEACDWLLKQGCTLIYFKYCSTFDSTETGNIGPVTEALMETLNVDSTLVCPALPVNGRTIYQGNLFVFDQLLSESGMRNHPITPMTDSNVIRLMASQTNGKSGHLAWEQVEKGAENITTEVSRLVEGGHQFIVCDAIRDSDLDAIAQTAKTHRLVTGGSGLVGAIAKVSAKHRDDFIRTEDCASSKRRGVILSGSCSQMTNKQVSAYKQCADHFKLDVAQCLQNDTYVSDVEKWVISHSSGGDYFPMVYATVEADELSEIQTQFGFEASHAIETLFNQLVKRLYANGFNVFISAGGETSGTVTQALSVESFKVGVEIAPGVPWMTSLNGELSLALKSGNFGNESFFIHAQERL